MFQDKYSRRRTLSVLATLAGSTILAGCNPTPYNEDALMTAAKLNEKIAKATQTSTKEGLRSSSSPSPEKRVIEPSKDEQRKSAHAKHHYEDPGTKEKLDVTPWLYFPFAKADVSRLKVTQGWFPDPEELKINKIAGHMALDISGPFGTQILAPTDGWYLATIQEGKRYATDPVAKKDVEITVKDKNGRERWIAYGGGLFIEFRPESGLSCGQILHCASVLVPFVKPTGNPETGWTPSFNNLETALFQKHAVFLKAGTPIGTMGVSGLGIETFGKYRGENVAPVYQKGDIETWDPANTSEPLDAHIHHETYRRTATKDGKGGTKYGRQDPTAIYGWKEDYTLDGKKFGKDPLYFTDSQGNLLFVA